MGHQRTHEDGSLARPAIWERLSGVEESKVLDAMATQKGARRIRLWQRKDGCRAIVAQEPLGPHGEYRWHLSLAVHGERYPSWDQLADARYDLLPHDRDFMLVLPRPTSYVNAHQWVFHLHECVEVPE